MVRYRENITNNGDNRAIKGIKGIKCYPEVSGRQELVSKGTGSGHLVTGN